MAEQDNETFRPTDGRVLGVLGLVVVLALLVLGIFESYPLWTIGLLATVGVLTWAAMLRPVVLIAGDELVLRNMYVTIGVPLGAIDEVAVGRVLAVRVGDRRFVSPAISRSLRQTIRTKRHPVGDGGRDLVALAASSYPDFVVERIRLAAAAHRARLGITDRSDEQDALSGQVRREVAWRELGVLAVAVLVLLVGILLAL